MLGSGSSLNTMLHNYLNYLQRLKKIVLYIPYVPPDTWYGFALWFWGNLYILVLMIMILLLLAVLGRRNLITPFSSNQSHQVISSLQSKDSIYKLLPVPGSCEVNLYAGLLGMVV